MKLTHIFKTMLFVALLIARPALSGDVPSFAQLGTESLAVPPKRSKQIILTMGSWRKDDVEQINYILHKFTEKHPDIVIKFDPTPPADYNAVIKTQLESGTAPDLLYLRSFSHSKKLFSKGYLASLNDIEQIEINFPTQMREAWSLEDGTLYGVPLMAVSHGIYYNSTFFDENNITIPKTWEDLLETAEYIKKQGFTPFANASGDAWTVNGLILQNVIPNNIGGAEGRLAYYNGERCFDDEQMVASFQTIKDITPYVSANQKLLRYADSLQLFIQGKSPMWFGGSWDIPFLEEQNPDFKWSIFPIPPPKGKEYYVTFHPDAGIGLNSSSPYITEAKQFLQWVTTSEFASLLVEHLPGFFPLHKEMTTIDNEHASQFLEFSKKYPTDSRFVWGKIRDGYPSAYDISLTSSVDIMNGRTTPQQAATNLQEGLEKWYEPATRCKE